MKKRIFSILLVVVMTMALVACGSQPTNVSAPEATETVSEAVESTDTENSEAVSTPETSTEVVEPESSEATSEPEQATEAPVDEVASTPDSEAVESEASEPEPNEPEFTFTEVNATKYAVQSVNVRSGPSTDFNKIGSLSTNQEVQVIFRCNETGWYKFIWTDGSEAYVSDKYLADEKVEKPAVSETPSNGGNSTAGTGSTASNWADGYPKNQWIDMGEYFFYIANSQAEANQVYGDYMLTHTKGEDCHIYHPDLEVRYPDRRMYIAAYTTRKGNVPVVIISTEANCDVSDPSWFCPTPIWEL